MLLAINITTELPWWLAFFCLLLGVVYAYLLYRKDSRFEEVNPLVKRVMFFSRALLVSILSFLLLSPFTKSTFNKIEKPIIIFAQDNSSSILMNKDSVFYKTTYLQKIEELTKKLAENFDVRTYSFSEELTELKHADYNDKLTNISTIFNEVESKFYNQNIGALIIASDGIYNKGENPIYASKSLPYSVYTITLGDTSVQRDLILKDVNHNKITFLNNQFPIEIYALANKSNGQKTTLKILHNETVVFNKEYAINSNNFSISETIILDAKQVGTQHYKIVFSSIENEVSIKNNSKDIYIDVLDGRQNVLILANAPHPDIKAIKTSIETNENYKVTSLLYSEFDGKLTPYSLIIAHQTPNNTPIFNQLTSSNVPTWFIIGNQSSEQEFNRLNLGININNSKNSFNDILPKINTQFPLFTISENTLKTIQNFPPLSGFFGNYQLKGNAYQLINQKIGSVETENPLLVFNELPNKKNAVLFGEGIWRWKMTEFLTTKNNDAVNELINKTVQFLAVKDDKSKFRIILNKNFSENEPILINAELYNDSYELINDPEVSLSITNQENKKLNFVFNKTSKAYVLDAGILVPYLYQFVASTKLGDKTISQKGQFQVNQLVLEELNTTADYQLMQNLAEKHQGKMFYPSNMNELITSVEKNETISSVIYEEHDLKDWINIKWIFIILIVLLTLEWFLRKRNGAY